MIDLSLENEDSSTGEEKPKAKIEDLIKKRPIKSKEEMVAEAKAALRRSVSSTYDSRPSKRERRNSDSNASSILYFSGQL